MKVHLALLSVGLAASILSQASGSTAVSQRRHHQEVSRTALSTGNSIATEEELAAATASAEAVADAAEREAEGVSEPAIKPAWLSRTASSPSTQSSSAKVKKRDEDQDDSDDTDADDLDDDAQPAPKTKSMEPAKPAALASTRTIATQVKKHDDEGEEEADDDGEDVDSDEAPAKPAPAVAAAKKQTLESHVSAAVSAVAVAPGQTLESHTPEGVVAKARARFQDNLRQQAEIAVEIARFSGESSEDAFNNQVDAEAQKVAGETQTKALAAVLGTMRKEMRKFASPFYLQHLLLEQKRLKALEPELQAELDAAEGGQKGNVFVSHLSPAAQLQLRGGDQKVTAAQPSHSGAVPRHVATMFAVPLAMATTFA